MADINGVIPRSMSEAVRLKAGDQLTPCEAVLRGFGYLARLDPDEHAAVRPALERAVREAPGYADAWAMLSDVYADEFTQGFNARPGSLDRALEAARRAVAAAPASALGHHVLAQALYFHREIPAFVVAAERAIALNPMDAFTVGFMGIYLRAMEGSDARAVAGTENATNPFFSPDGRWLGFLAAGKLQKVPVGGGAPHVLADVTNSDGATWTGAHTIAFAPLASPVQQVSDQGGTPTSLTRMEPGETLQGQPRRLPDEAGVLFGALTAKDQVIALQLPGGGRKDLVRGRLGGMPQYSPSGHLVFVQGDTLMALPFDLAQRAVKNTAPPVPVVRGVLQFALSLDGTLAYIQGRPDWSPRRLVWVSRGGVVEPLNAPPGDLYQPRLSPDGRRVALDIRDDAGRPQVGIYDLARDTLAPFTFDGLSRHPIWTRDSRYLLFQSSRDGTQRIYRQPSDGSGEPLPVTEETLPASAGVFNIPFSVSSDGVLTYTKLFPTRNAQVWVSHLTGTPGVPGGDARQFLETDSADGAPQLSPDGRWLAYASAQAGRGRQIYVRAFPGPGGPWQVSMDGGNEPQWNPRGGELFFRNGRRMVAVDVDTRDGFRASKPRTLFEGEFDQVRLGYARANYDVSPDGQRFLMLQKAQPDPAPPREIHVVLNWSEELSRLARPQP